ncbi:cyclin domain protein [Aulographum hederae CBS 113979]|uniref:Cyclin domain protein n=1 Tax=Aulographum hederae CBS 113979 TaxID=1176131 RepID=A0A6G1GSB2_9PEZI|nr:cyclin domain protein [Aulographum hederae CBS 113979]
MAPEPLSILTNPLATVEQLTSSSSQFDGVPADLETSIIHAGARLTQAAGILLQLPQDIIAQAIVLFTRFWIGSEGGSLLEHNASDVSAATIYLVSKLSAYQKSPRSVINTYAYLASLPATFPLPSTYIDAQDASTYHVSEGTYLTSRQTLNANESLVLRILGFQTHVALPHALSITYMQTLSFIPSPSGTALAARTFEHLNAALLSPQLLYLTHPPATLAVAAIYVAAREIGTKLPEGEWWEVFDCEREDLGFLVLAMGSFEGFVREEVQKWGRRGKVPLTAKQVAGEIEKRTMLEEGA